MNEYFNETQAPALKANLLSRISEQVIRSIGGKYEAVNLRTAKLIQADLDELKKYEESKQVA